jgi:hypothetical protein
MEQQPGGQCEVQAIHNAHNKHVPDAPAVGGGAGGDLSGAVMATNGDLK